MTLPTVILALGLVLVLEGLVFVLAPSRIEDLLRQFAQLPVTARRLIGALAIVCGMALVLLARQIAGA